MEAMTALLVPGLLLALVLLLIVAFAVGLAIVVRPALLDRLRGVSDRRVSFRRATRPLDIPRNIDPWFYRHHRIYGLVVVVLSAFLLYFLAFGYETPAWVAVFPAEYREIALMGAEVARFLLWVVAVLGVITGTTVFVRPSALKGVEAWANRWITPRRLTRGLDREYDHPDAWVSRHPRAWGLVIALSAGLVLLALLLHWGTVMRSLA